MLLIDRDGDTRDLLHSLFAHHGFDAIAAGSYDEAHRCAEVGAFDLVITGFIVDSVDPRACWNELDRIRDLARCRIGILSGFPIHAVQAEEHRIAFALVKPCTALELLAEVSAALQFPPLSPARAEVVTTYFDALQGGAYQGLAELCTDDIVYHLPRAQAPMPERVVGKAELVALAEQTFRTFRDPIFQIEDVRPLPDGALVRYQSTWRDPDDNARSLAGAVLFEFAHDKIREVGVRCDLSQIPT